MKAWLIPISLVLLADTARADQCEWVDKAAALKAQTIVKKAPLVIHYCEPCGDAAPGAPEEVKTATVQRIADDYWSLSINGKDVDLAYLFVKTSDARYENLASVAGCPATGVSPSLAIQSETRTGVIINADDYKPADMTIVTEIPSSYAYKPAEPPPPPPPQVYVYEKTTTTIAWLPLMLAAVGGVITGSALMLLLVAARRRRAMKPRAVDLGKL